MNVIFRVLSAASVGVMMFAGTVKAETVLTLSSWVPATHPQVANFIVPMAADIERVTEGRVKVKILPAPLGPPAAAFDLAKNGVADITYSVQGYTPGRFKTAAIGEMPFLSDDAVATSVAFWRVYEKYLASAGEYDGVKVMAIYTHGPGEMFSSKPIENVDDIEGQKIRIGGVVAKDIVTSLGGVPVEGPSSKSYELLSQGVADGIFFPYESVNFFKLIDLVDYGYAVPGGIYNTAMFVVMNHGKWDSLPPEDQAAISTIIGEPLSRKAGEMWNEADARGRAAMEGKVRIHEAGETDMTALREKLQPIIDNQIAVVSATGVDGQAAYEMLKAEIAKVEAESAQ